MDLKGRDFLKLLDFTPEEIVYLLDLAAELKEKKKKMCIRDSPMPGRLWKIPSGLRTDAMWK